MDRTDLTVPPPALPVDSGLPESFRYRLKRRLLGPPLITSQLAHERLSKKAALGVLSSDCISSSAYGSEEMLIILLPAFGLAAYALVLPVTAVVLGVLILVTLSYRQVVMVYTRAGGSYVVARDNFGPSVAQIAAVALMLDYIVTVAVQSAAGTAAVVSALPALAHLQLEITVVVVGILFYGNLRGIREAGKAFAFPTYFFASMMGLVIVAGIIRELVGDLPHYAVHVPGAFPAGHGEAILSGAAVYVLLKSFANGGSSLTGLEAISNGVSAFKPPEGPNARRTLVVMSCILGSLVLGVSWLAHETHAVPYLSGAPTVISQVAKATFSGWPGGHMLFLLVQLATMLILYTGANTPFSGFPFLASFVAEDRFLPHQLTKRGHRLAFSNGIIVLAALSVTLLLVTGAHVDKLVAFYAIGVFTGFTMAGFGMARHYSREQGPGWRSKVAVNTAAGGLSLLVVLIFAVVKFTEGAWLVVVVFPVAVLGLIRLNRRYRAEAAALEDIPTAAPMANIARHKVFVLADTLDLATVRALRYARSLKPAEMHAVHFVVDRDHAEELYRQWEAHPSIATPLQLVDCPDRRIERAALDLCARHTADNVTEVTLLLPRRAYGGLARVLHDNTADQIARAVSKVPHAAATIVPFDVDEAVERLTADRERRRLPGGRRGQAPTRPPAGPPAERPAERAAEQPATVAVHTDAGVRAVPIGEVGWRRKACVEGQIRSVAVRDVAGSPALAVEVCDPTGGLTAVFLGRRRISGLDVGRRVRVEGMVGDFEGHLAMKNPTYTIVADEG